jgi:hypothetical protein
LKYVQPEEGKKKKNQREKKKSPTWPLSTCAIDQRRNNFCAGGMREGLDIVGPLGDSSPRLETPKMGSSTSKWQGGSPRDATRGASAADTPRPGPAKDAPRRGLAASQKLPSSTKPKGAKKATDGQLQRNSASFNPLL